MILPVVVASCVAAIAGHAMLVAPFALVRTVVDLPVRDLPEPFEAYTIVVLADLHQPPYGRASLVRRAVAIANAAHPDLVVLLGDYGDSFELAQRLSRWMYARAMTRLAQPLSSLRSRDGVVAVLGNHDHLADAQEVRRWLAALGATVLVNASHRITRAGAELQVAGLDDTVEGTVDPLGGISPAAAHLPTIVLSHHPDGASILARDRRVDVVLAGHTHGGQVVLPGIGAPVTLSRACGRRTASGWVPNDRAPLFVSRGVGTQIPLRFRCPPEVVVMRLRRAD